MSVNTVLTGMPTMKGTWLPVIQGVVSNPSAVTYSVQVGSYSIIGDRCFFTATIVTTSITKAGNLTDAVRISLPFAAATQTNAAHRCAAAAYNATPVACADQGRIPSGASYVELWQQGLAAVGVALTWALVTGIGILTNTITVEISGSYPIAI